MATDSHLPVESVDGVVEYVSELNPPLVHVYAAPDERAALMEAIGAASERTYDLIHEGATAAACPDAAVRKFRCGEARTTASAGG